MSVAREIHRKTRILGVMDREAGFLELFSEQRRHGRVETRVQANHDRGPLGTGSRLFDALHRSPVSGEVEIGIDRRSERLSLGEKDILDNED